MVQKITKGDRVRLTWRVTNVWPDGRISMKFPTLPDPITVHQEDIDEVLPKERPPKEKPVGGRRKFFDKGD